MSDTAAGRRARADSRLAVGLMAGTSLDGVDAALVRLAGPPERPVVRLLAFATVPYPAALRERLFQVAGGQATTAGTLGELNFRVGEEFAQAALAVCCKARISPGRLGVIGSHGQTVFHQGPAPRAGTSSTLQIGEAAVIAQRTGVPVVADFRAADIAAGGQGAPLVPLVDYLLLRDDRRGTIALNLGGIANVTLIPPGARPDEVFGFDTGPGNMVMDALVRHFTKGRKHYDVEGRLAAQGKVIEPLLEEALRLPFFKWRPPKSAGREQFGRAFVERFFLRGTRMRLPDLLRTATELTARSVADALKSLVKRDGFRELVISGGGAHNRLLVRRLSQLLPDLTLRRSDDYGLPVDAKEAMAFAVLADRTIHGLPGNLPSVTGARRPVVLGKLVRP